MGYKCNHRADTIFTQGEALYKMCTSGALVIIMELPATFVIATLFNFQLITLFNF